MKKCILFFVVLVSTIVLAVLTDDDRSSFKKDVMVKYKMQTEVDIAEHQILPIPNY